MYWFSFYTALSRTWHADCIHVFRGLVQLAEGGSHAYIQVLVTELLQLRYSTSALGINAV